MNPWAVLFLAICAAGIVPGAVFWTVDGINALRRWRARRCWDSTACMCGAPAELLLLDGSVSCIVCDARARLEGRRSIRCAGLFCEPVPEHEDAS